MVTRVDARGDAAIEEALDLMKAGKFIDVWGAETRDGAVLPTGTLHWD